MNRGVITMEFRGRFGNLCSQYAFCRALAENYGYDLLIPHDWKGRMLWDVPFEHVRNYDSFTTVDLDAMLVNRGVDRVREFLPKLDGARIRCYAQHQVFIDTYSRTDARAWLKLHPRWNEYNHGSEPKYSAVHKRRGDYTQEPFNRYYCSVSDESYNRAIAQFKLPEPIYTIQEGWRESYPSLVALGVEFIPDFFALKNATHLIRANSSFSWWAAALGNGTVYSPVVGHYVGWRDVEFLEGNWPRTSGHNNQSDLHLKPK